jgi:capsular polysaccharide transport system permease protein
MTWLHPACIVQFRVIGALLLRETRTRFGKSRLGYAWALLSPLLQISILSGLFYMTGRHIPPVGNSIILFFASGVLPYQLFMKTSNMIMNAIRSNDALMYFPVVEQLDAILARYFLEVATYTLIMIILFGVIINIFDLPLPEFLPLIGSICGLSFLALGLGLCNAVIISFIKSWDRIFSAVSTPLYFLSGVFFLMDTLPPAAAKILILNPVFHGIEWFREGIYMQLESSQLDQMYLFKWGILLMVIGLSLERVLRRFMRRGT